MDERLKLRIDELAAKKKLQGLTNEEQAEQTELYRLYIDEIKTQLKGALDNEGFKPKQ